MSKFFVDGHLRYQAGAWRDDNGDAVDIQPVRHGRWESVKNPQWPAYSHDKCSLCGWWNTKNALCYDGHKKPGHSLNYCPNCGAKMDALTFEEASRKLGQQAAETLKKLKEAGYDPKR